MRTSMISVLAFLLATTFACQSNSDKQGSGSQSGCIRTKLVAKDSAGVLTGGIAMWDKPSAIVTYGGLWVVDSDNDTIIFRVEPNKTENLDETKLEKGRCVSVSYSREIVEEDGIELNRFYYATRLDYP